MSNHIVFYKKHYHRIDEYNLPDVISGDDFIRHWEMIKIINANNLEEVYYHMQGEVWSPNGEARDFISQTETGHTSMSIGDIVNTCDGNFFMVDRWGFKNITLTPY